MSEQPSPPDGAEEPSEPSDPRSILDPDKAVAEHRARSGAGPTVTPVIDTKRYRWAIGIFGIGLVIVISVVQLLSNGVHGGGIGAGTKLQNFAAPVATSNLVGDANFSKPCKLAYFGTRAVNTCLLTRGAPLVLALFVTGSDDCVRSIDATQAVSKQFPSVRFAAVAIDASQSDTAKLVRSHHWTIPVAYDRDGAVGQVYGVQICPMIELVRPGGTVKDRLIGDRWESPGALAAKVRALAG